MDEYQLKIALINAASLLVTISRSICNILGDSTPDYILLLAGAVNESLSDPEYCVELIQLSTQELEFEKGETNDGNDNTTED